MTKLQPLQDSHFNESDEPIEIFLPAGERVRLHSANGRENFEYFGGDHGDSVMLHPGERISAI